MVANLRRLVARTVVVVGVGLMVSGCLSSGPSQSYLDGQNFGNQYGAGAFSASSPQRQCDLFFAQENLGASENFNDWVNGCISAIQGGSFSGLNNGP